MTEFAPPKNPEPAAVTDGAHWSLVANSFDIDDPFGQGPYAELLPYAPPPELLPALGVLDLLSQERTEINQLAALLGVPADRELIKQLTRTELGRLMPYYGARTLPQAFCIAVDARHIKVPLDPSPVLTGYLSTKERRLFRNVAAGRTEEELTATLREGETLDNVRWSMQTRLNAGSSFLSIMRRGYEIGLRKVPQIWSAPQTAVSGLVFTLPEGLDVVGLDLQMTSLRRDLLDDQFHGMSNGEIAERWSLAEADVKEQLRAVYACLGASSVAGALAKSHVLGTTRFGPLQPEARASLTGYQIRVFGMVALDMSDEAIGDYMGITEVAAAAQVHKTLKKLAVSRRELAVDELFRTGIFRVGTTAGQ